MTVAVANAQSKDTSQFISHSGRVTGDSDVFHRPTVTSDLVPRFRIAITAEEDVLRKAASGRC